MSVRTALIVDDSRVARLALARRLGARGIDVVSVASGADALRKLQETTPDVIFMDYMMPEMDGLEACSAIVNNPATASIPVIMTTSNDTPEFRKRGVASGASGFLSKGLEDREMDNVLDGVAGAKIEQLTGAAMATGTTQLSEETLAMVRDQAINAARQASEEYFTGQLPGLEEQVVQVAENAARRATGGAPAGGGGREDVSDIRSRLDNLENDPQLRALVSKIISEQGSGVSSSPVPLPTSGASGNRGSAIGRFFKWLIILAILLVIGYFALTILLPDHPVTGAVSDLVRALSGVIANFGGGY